MSDENQDWSTLTPAQLEAAKDGGDPFTAPASAEEEEEAPEAPEEESPAEEAAETPAEEPAQPQQPVEDSPNFKAMRQKLAQAQSALADPNALAQAAARLGYQLTRQETAAVSEAVQGADDPFAAFDDQTAAALRTVLESVTAPLHEALRQQQEAAKTEAERAAIAELDQEIPGFKDMVARFDERLPDEAHKYQPVDKFLITMGARAVDPGERVSLVTELLDSLTDEERQSVLAPRTQADAVQMLAEKIKPSNKPGKPVTLSGASAARDNDITPDVSRLSTDGYRRLSPAQRDKLLG